jgi:hypothetical protein
MDAGEVDRLPVLCAARGDEPYGVGSTSEDVVNCGKDEEMLGPTWILL